MGLPIDNISSTYSAAPIAASLALSLLVLVELVTFFAFVDTMVPVTRRSDPLLRGILHWDKVRFVLWGDLGLAAIYLVISGLDPSSTSAGLTAAVGFPLFLLPFVFGAPAILIGARRSRDSVLRRSLMWFGGFLGLVLFDALLSFTETIVLGISMHDAVLSYPALVFAPGDILAAYCIYKSARSLAPINSLSSVEPETFSPERVSS